MKVLIACEFSGIVRRAFNARCGVFAESCDIIPCEDGCGDVHRQCDVLTILDKGWDMMIAFPPCTHLASSGARHFAAKRADGRQQQGIDFFMALVNAPIPRIAIENPVGIMSTVYRKPDQIIQPYQFGHPESKATCLWLKGLPKLTPTRILTQIWRQNPDGTDAKDSKGKRYNQAHNTPRIRWRWNNQTPTGQNNLPPTEFRAKLRSITYAGIAEAMASQWGCLPPLAGPGAA